ncbi:MAG: hypothetical protein Q9174_002955 [Haloplaca sp. 1 TL-2023]
MTAAVDSPSRPPKRHRPKQRNTAGYSNQSESLAQEVALFPGKIEPEVPNTTMDVSSSPQPTTLRVASDSGGNGGFDSSPRGPTKSRPTKQTPKKKSGGIRNGTSPNPKKNTTPGPKNQTHSSMTPVQQSTTPIQYYAGPTFHASPAASSLPMPKFLSKSVPEASKDPSLPTTATQETGESSSEQSEDSPTPASVQPMKQQPPPREESPLDIFFKADRQEKERQRKEQEAEKGSTHPDRPQHHSRQSTNGSMGGLFPLELENKDRSKVAHDEASGFSLTAQSSETQPPTASTRLPETPEQLQQRKAKTAALKKFLYSPSTTGEATLKPTSDLTSSPPISDPGETQRPTQTGHSPVQRHLAAQKPRRMSPGLRPSSHLRREVSASTLPESGSMSELPATPTPSRSRNAYRSTPEEGQRQPLFDGIGSKRVEHDLARSTPVSESMTEWSPYKKMEDDLRRILKMDGLPSDGVTGVPS